jgi:hypothetical protein
LITSCILSDPNVVKLELNYNNSRKYANNWRLNNTLLNYQWVIEDEIKRFWEVNENENTLPEPMGHSKGSPKRKFIAMSAYIKRTERFHQ